MTSLKNGVNLSSSFGHLISDMRTLASSLLNEKIGLCHFWTK